MYQTQKALCHFNPPSLRFLRVFCSPSAPSAHSGWVPTAHSAPTAVPHRRSASEGTPQNGGTPQYSRHEAEFGVSTDGPALPQRSGRHQPLLPALVVPRTVPTPALRMGWSQKGDTPPRRGSRPRWHCPPHGPRGHLHGLDDGDHISLMECQLAGLGLGVVVLGDALCPRRPMFLQEEGRFTGVLSPEVSPSWKDSVVA